MKRFLFALALATLSAVSAAGNISTQAKAVASSTYCSGPDPSEHCYNARRANDGITNTSLGGLYSWTNQGGSAPHTWTAIWRSYVEIDSATVFTSQGYPIKDFDFQYFDAYTSSWRTLRSVRGNRDLRIELNFSSVIADRVRILARSGPSHQTVYMRLNEVMIEGDARYL